MAVRRPDKSITTETWETFSGGKKWYHSVPIVRGCVSFVESLRVGSVSYTHLDVYKRQVPMKPVLALLGVCLLTGLLSSCSMVPANTEDLLEPPKLSPDQAALAEALERGLGTDDFTLKYPISGENRSAYILCNLRCV